MDICQTPSSLSSTRSNRSQPISSVPLLVLSLLFACLLPTRPASAQALPRTFDVPITPCPISNPPTSITWLNRSVGDPTLAREHRQAMLDAWDILIQRNSNPVLDHALRNQPNMGAQDVMTWRFSMVEYFRNPLMRSFESSKKGRPPFIEPLRGSDHEISVVPPNGAITLARHLFDWLLVEQELDAEESILTNLPLVLATLEDWLEGEDTFFNLDDFVTTGMLQLAVESPGPNLAHTLLDCPSPYRWTATRFSQRRHLFLFNGQSSQPTLDKISDLSLPDTQVLPDCAAILTKSYEHRLRFGIYLAPSLETWLNSLKHQAEKNRTTLIAAKRIDQPTADTMHPYRLAILAAISEFEAFAQRHAELITLPTHEAIQAWLQESDLPSDPNRPEYWKPMSELSRDFAFFYAQSHWYSQQGIRAASLFYYLRDHLAHHGTLPNSLQLLPANPSVIDPITNQPFLYQRTSPYQATLQLSHHRGGPRQIWNLTAPKP